MKLKEALAGLLAFVESGRMVDVLFPNNAPEVIAAREALKGECAGKACARALAVMVLDKRISAWLQANDPKAFQQACDALKDFGHVELC